MDQSNPSSANVSRSATPNPATNSRFTAQNATAEDLLKSQTVGLVQLSDFRKRRAEALELKQITDGSLVGSGTATPKDGAATPLPSKKKRKKGPKGKLSFGVDDEEEEATSGPSVVSTPRSNTPDGRGSKEASATPDPEASISKKRLGANTGVAFVPKAMTKGALLREAQAREQLRKEFLAIQERVKATEISIPFVFYDGTNVPGGKCRVKKGDHIWFFLDKARKVGAELGVGGDKSRREWARVSVDDLMLVRGEIIIPHHYDFHHFIINKTVGFNGPIFDFSAEPTAATPASVDTPEEDLTSYDPLTRPKNKKDKDTKDDTELEGPDNDPTITKVVDRRWYEKNKHIFPASIWEEFDPTKDYSKGIRQDAEGNAFFFS